MSLSRRRRGTDTLQISQNDKNVKEKLRDVVEEVLLIFLSKRLLGFSFRNKLLNL